MYLFQSEIQPLLDALSESLKIDLGIGHHKLMQQSDAKPAAELKYFDFKESFKFQEIDKNEFENNWKRFENKNS